MLTTYGVYYTWTKYLYQLFWRSKVTKPKPVSKSSIRRPEYAHFGRLFSRTHSRHILVIGFPISECSYGVVHVYINPCLWFPHQPLMSRSTRCPCLKPSLDPCQVEGRLYLDLSPSAQYRKDRQLSRYDGNRIHHWPVRCNREAPPLSY